ncbi:uncharacterized protein ACR2FA_010548 [Aphomia sociella]
MDALKWFYIVVFIIYEVKSDCTLNIPNEKYSPVFAVRNRGKLSTIKNIAKNKNNLTIVIKTSDVLVIACSGKKTKKNSNPSNINGVLEAECRANGIFYVNKRCTSKAEFKLHVIPSTHQMGNLFIGL